MRTWIAMLALAVAPTMAWAQCQPLGWIKVGETLMSPSERACTYEKQGVRVTIIVSGFCPMNPC